MFIFYCIFLYKFYTLAANAHVGREKKKIRKASYYTFKYKKYICIGANYPMNNSIRLSRNAPRCLQFPILTNEIKKTKRNEESFYLLIELAVLINGIKANDHRLQLVYLLANRVQFNRKRAV